MAHLNVNGKQYEAKVTFKFRSAADKKYSTKANDNEVDGFTNIYSNLLEENVGYLAAFWDCALSHLKDRPTVDEIEKALEEQAGEEQDYDPFIKEAFQAVDEAGFFRSQVKKFWNSTSMYMNFVENDKEKAAMEQEVQRMKETRARLTGNDN